MEREEDLIAGLDVLDVGADGENVAMLGDLLGVRGDDQARGGHLLTGTEVDDQVRLCWVETVQLGGFHGVRVTR